MRPQAVTERILILTVDHFAANNRQVDKGVFHGLDRNLEYVAVDEPEFHSQDYWDHATLPRTGL